MTNVLTPVSHSGLSRSGLSQSRAVKRLGPDRASIDETGSAATGYCIDPARAAHAAASRPHRAYVAGFVAQAIANDNGPHMTPYDAARAYWDMNYRLADLPVGFLVSRSV